jgi:hypothetical protein
MAKAIKSNENTTHRATLVTSRQTAKDQIQEQIKKGEAIKNVSERKGWLVFVRELLRRIVDNDELLDQFNTDYYVTEGFEEDLSKSVNEAIVILRSIYGKLDLIPEIGTGTQFLSQPAQTVEKNIFIVHGHDSGMRETVARFVEKFGLTPIILGERPNEGKTIIEKFLSYSDVAFAIVLLTGDDRGGTKNEPFENLRLRARQNVIFELGFFIGKLGRKRVCALYEEGVEIPSDYQGVLFVPIDKGENWKWQVAKEMKNSGLEIDLNSL